MVTAKEAALRKADVTGRRQFPSPNPRVIGDGVPNVHSGTGNKPIWRVVIHSAVMPCEPGRAVQLGQMNQTSETGSWHYATDPKDVVQCSWDSIICWHAPPNPHTVGIEMADHPVPWPQTMTKRIWANLVRRWRWRGKNHRRMLHNTAELTAELCLAEELPIRFVTARMMRRNPRAEGITTHACTSNAFHQSSHWDPGAWPRRRFMRLVRRYAREIREN